MNIQSKFNIHDMLKHKYTVQPKDTHYSLEVMEIITQTCYAGTQIFYLCRQIICIKRYEHEFTKTGDSAWEIGHSIPKDENGNGWLKYREDELIEASKEAIEIITTKNKEL